VAVRIVIRRLHLLHSDGIRRHAAANSSEKTTAQNTRWPRYAMDELWFVNEVGGGSAQRALRPPAARRVSCFSSTRKRSKRLAQCGRRQAQGGEGAVLRLAWSLEMLEMLRRKGGRRCDRCDRNPASKRGGGIDVTGSKIQGRRPFIITVTWGGLANEVARMRARC